MPHIMGRATDAALSKPDHESAIPPRLRRRAATATYPCCRRTTARLPWSPAHACRGIVPAAGFMDYFLQQLINGLTLGAIYGLIAIGYTMVYGIIGMLNFAHGEIYMTGAFV